MAVTGTTSTASDIQMDYMKLLVTQLQNQNPLEPMDNADMTSQLAQFSQLNQMETLNSSFSRVLDSVQRDYASSLIGKEISFEGIKEDGTTETRTGTVQEVAMGDDGDILLMVNNENVNLSDVTSIREG
jgi:flagellar basal-body rod modification protein FlgD